jgi:hypothetical protein
MIDWTLTQPFHQHMATLVPGDDPAFGEVLRKLVESAPETVTNKQLNRLTRQVLAHQAHTSIRQQTYFWHLVGRCYFARQKYKRAFEAFMVSLQTFDSGTPQADWLVRANLSFALATVGQYVQHHVWVLAQCDVAIQAVQTREVQNYPGLSREDCEAALEAARTLRAKLAASKHGPFVPSLSIRPHLMDDDYSR